MLPVLRISTTTATKTPDGLASRCRSRGRARVTALLVVGCAKCVAVYAWVTCSWPAVGVAVATTNGRGFSGATGGGRIERMLQPTSSHIPTLSVIPLTTLRIFRFLLCQTKKGRTWNRSSKSSPFVPQPDATRLGRRRLEGFLRIEVSDPGLFAVTVRRHYGYSNRLGIVYASRVWEEMCFKTGPRWSIPVADNWFCIDVIIDVSTIELCLLSSVCSVVFLWLRARGST